MKKTPKWFETKINRAKAKIAKDRDELRALLEEANDITETCDEAIEALESAADSLSKYL